MMRLDHNRAIAQLANKLGAPVADGHQHDRLGQPLDDPVPGPGQRQGRRRERLGRGRRRGLDRRRVHPQGRQARRRDHRGARRLERRLGRQRRDRPRPRLGARHARRATGSRWGCPPTAPTASSEGIICGLPCTCSGGEWSIVEGLEITDFSRERIDASVAELGRARRGRRARAGLSPGAGASVTASPERPPRDRLFERGGEEFARVLAFSDGMFAIAMTLLVVGIAVPTLDVADSSSELADALNDLSDAIRQLLHQLRGDRPLLGGPPSAVLAAARLRSGPDRAQPRLSGADRVSAVSDRADRQLLRQPARGRRLRRHGRHDQRARGGAVAPRAPQWTVRHARCPTTSTGGRAPVR